MKLLLKYFVIFLFAAGYALTAQENNKQYLQELKTFKTSAAYKTIFDHHYSFNSIRQLQRDIHNYQQLSFIHRLLTFVFFNMNVVIATPDTMPKLCTFVESICKSQKMKTPTIFITTKKGFFNAAASKLFASSGGIVMGQRIIEESTDEQLEAVIAHELGHIKYNHVNKAIGLQIAIAICLSTLFNKSTEEHRQYMTPQEQFSQSFYNGLLAGLYSGPLAQLAIGKHFEKQADEFAYKTLGRGKGLKEFFNVIINKEQIANNSFGQTRALIKNMKSNLTLLDYSLLNVRYAFAKVGHLFYKINRWIYHNTRLGAHPSPEARIKAVENYMAL